MSMIYAWGGFALCAMLLGFAGPALTRNGEVIAHLTGLSRSWVGLAMLATATSLPELFTGLSAVSVADAPNIAVGDALGSCLFNLVMIVVLDALSREEAVYRRIDQGHILTAGFGVILIGFVGALLLLSHSQFSHTIAHVSIYTPFLIVLYFVAMRSAYFYERRPREIEAAQEAKEAGISLGQAIARFALSASIVAVAGGFLPFSGLRIAEAMNWQTSFVGTLFVGAATSLPELIVTIAALRMGSTDMAIGNLLGSNLFAVLVLAVDDLAYTKGSLLASASPAHAFTAIVGAIMSGILIVALLYRPGHRFFGIGGWISLSLLATYLLGAYAIFLHGH